MDIDVGGAYRDAYMPNYPETTLLCRGITLSSLRRNRGIPLEASNPSAPQPPFLHPVRYDLN